MLPLVVLSSVALLALVATALLTVWLMLKHLEKQTESLKSEILRQDGLIQSLVNQLRSKDIQTLMSLEGVTQTPISNSDYIPQGDEFELMRYQEQLRQAGYEALDVIGEDLTDDRTDAGFFPAES